MLADQLDYVIGVDTHRETHALAVVVCASGARVFEASVAGCAGGYAEALALAERWAPARRPVYRSSFSRRPGDVKARAGTSAPRDEERMRERDATGGCNLDDSGLLRRR